MIMYNVRCDVVEAKEAVSFCVAEIENLTKAYQLHCRNTISYNIYKYIQLKFTVSKITRMIMSYKYENVKNILKSKAHTITHFLEIQALKRLCK